MENGKCYISNKEFPEKELIKASSIRIQLFNLIRKDFPKFSMENYISADSLNVYRKIYLKKLLTSENKELGKLEYEIIETIHNNKILSENIEPEIDAALTIGQKVSDKIATFGGSWTFIIVFFSFLLIWMLINILVLLNKPFDPYPFILLNLILSTLAAIQAPIIMMSQNRKEQKDRMRSEQDYKVNLI